MGKDAPKPAAPDGLTQRKVAMAVPVEEAAKAKRTPTAPGVENKPSAASEPGDLVSQNIQAIADLQARAERGVSRYQRSIEFVTSFLGRPRFFYLILVIVFFWIGENLLAPRLHWHQWDPPPFPWLQGAITLGALLMTTVVLITQNRQGQMAERRAHLDLQVNLLSEQKVAKLIALVEELRRDLPNVQNRHDPEAEAMTEAADPHAVLSALEETLERAEDKVQELEEMEEAEQMQPEETAAEVPSSAHC